MSDRHSIGNEATVPVVSVAAGDFLFRAGDPADSFFIISTGQIELLRQGETHGRLALLTTGDVCGEDSAFDGQARAYDARAVTKAMLLRVGAALFHDLVRTRPELATAVISRTAGLLVRARAARLSLALPFESGQTSRTAARLVHVESGTQFPLPDAPEIVIGRSDPRFKPDVELSSIDAHRSLSRRHAVIHHVENGYRIVEPAGVTNGTFLNGTRLSPGVPAPIENGDEISFGLITAIFRTT
jgi:CRP-like cAMP-binding protein